MSDSVTAVPLRPLPLREHSPPERLNVLTHKYTAVMNSQPQVAINFPWTRFFGLPFPSFQVTSVLGATEC